MTRKEEVARKLAREEGFVWEMLALHEKGVFLGKAIDEIQQTQRKAMQHRSRELTERANIKIRLDEWIRRKLEEAAIRNRRSLNAEICLRLEASFEFKDVILRPAKPGGKPKPMFDIPEGEQQEETVQ